MLKSTVLPRLKSAVLAGAIVALTALPSAAQTAAPRGPDGISDVIDAVIDSVVMISTSEDVDGSGPDDEQAPELAPDQPLDQFFDDFFKKQQGGEAQARPTGEGSGFVIDPNGTIVTNYHVIEDADQVKVTFNDGSKAAAEVVGKDKDTDIAVLKVKPTDKPFRAVHFGNAEQLRLGEWVLAMGNPFGIGLSATSGIVSGRNRDMRTGRYDNFIQTDASINKGNSGGPLFNLAGEVVGMNTAILSPTGGSVGIGFAVPASTLQPVVDQLLKYGETRRGYIGVRIQDVPPAVISRLGLKDVQGALVAGVVAGGPAATAGLKTGDVIVNFSGKPVSTSRSFQRMVADAGVDADVPTTIWRDGKEVQMTLHIGQMKEQAAENAVADADASKTAKPVPLPTGRVLGLDMAPLNDETRTRFSVDDTIEGGVIVIAVTPSSPLKDQNIGVGDVVVGVAQQKVSSPEDLSERLADLKKQGQSSALALVATPKAEMRFLRVPLE